SVSRVGGAAQTKAIKKLAGGIRTDLAQYRELAAFSQFASDLDEVTRKQLERGKRVTELMKQKQFKPLSVTEMALSLTAANEGYLDDIPVEKINDFETALHDYAATNAKDLAEKIGDNGNFSDEIAAQLKQVIETFKAKGVY
ncbi:MAG: F0F1 ATP synthase subunit alpha, partial [Halothiobacillus sp.]|nr:F0F1 ATP synthase subunit alpha [Halothiobacillus sp.]